MTTHASNNNQIKEWLHLRLCDQVGCITFYRLIAHFETITAVLAASASDMQCVEGIGCKTAHAIVASREQINPEDELAHAKKLGIQIITQKCDNYPTVLKKIYDPPPILWVKGTLTRNDTLAVALVGSRNCSFYGQEQASRFAHLLSGAGFTIVSGLARGIDTAAHRGALAANGRTIAVCGCGLGYIYPKENRPLANQIRQSGAVISEQPIHTKPLAHYFPQRNRIISGLALGTIIVEAQHRSGALGTARCALDQNREVMAIPGHIDTPGATGPHQLIKDGATLVENIQDVVAALGHIGHDLKPHINCVTNAIISEIESPKNALTETQIENMNLNDTQHKILNVIKKKPIHLNDIVAQINCPPGKVIANITLLQLKGLIAAKPGSYYHV
jgi:DNA processing protein